MTEPTRIDVGNGQYTVVINQGTVTSLRNGKPWLDLSGNRLVYHLAADLAQAQALLRAQASATVGSLNDNISLINAEPNANLRAQAPIEQRTRLL